MAHPKRFGTVVVIAVGSLPWAVILPRPSPVLAPKHSRKSGMILELDNWHLGYAQMVKDCQVDESTEEQGTVLILCNADVDSMAAARILSFMLRSDNITYQLRPCTSYTALHKVLEQANDHQDSNLKALVLLNLGASRNLTRLFDEHGLSSQTRVYVMDCRRPFHLANVHAGQNVVLFWDETQTDVPSDGDNLSGNESTSSEEDSESESDSEEEEEDKQDDLEAEFDEEVVGVRSAQIREDRGYDGEDDDPDDDPENERSRATSSKRRKKNHDFPDESSDTTKETEDQDNESEDGGGPQKNNESSRDDDPPLISPRELHRQRRNRLRMYYSGGSFYGSPAAYITYRLSTQLRFAEQGNLLWLACVGVTDAYLHSRLDVAGYTTLSLNLKQYCMRLFPNDMYHRLERATYAEHLTGAANREENRQLTTITLSENGRVVAEQDFRFFLLRHTSLYDGMVHSNYVSTKLQLWTKKGMNRFHELLAKMGCPLEQCRQPYPFMEPKVRRSLRDKLVAFANEYGLEKFEFTCFKRVTGYNSLLSASDMSYAVTALLECDTPATRSSPSKEGDAAAQGDTEDRNALEAFNIAYDALNCSSSPNMILSEGSSMANLVNGGSMAGNTGIGAGIRLAMSLQKSIMATAVSLVDRNAITRLRHFRYAYITCTGQDGTSGEETDQSHVFAKPLALTKLAHYLMDMHRENGKWAGNKARPLVLLAEKPRTNTYLVVGYEYPERTGDFVKNQFGQNFELAAKTMKGTFRFDSFDSNVVEVDSESVQRLVEQLHYMLDSM